MARHGAAPLQHGITHRRLPSATGGGIHMYSADVRWLVVYKRLWLGEDHATVTEAFCGRVCKDTQNLIIGRPGGQHLARSRRGALLPPLVAPHRHHPLPSPARARVVSALTAASHQIQLVCGRNSGAGSARHADPIMQHFIDVATVAWVAVTAYGVDAIVRRRDETAHSRAPCCSRPPSPRSPSCSGCSTRCSSPRAP